ncbi:hypothetical protein GZL_00847 [Streptomyces sp. 769]|nr:hypothetical protein GZL_00847 [Streptomyces sp. 769]
MAAASGSSRIVPRRIARDGFRRRGPLTRLCAQGVSASREAA